MCSNPYADTELVKVSYSRLGALVENCDLYADVVTFNGYRSSGKTLVCESGCGLCILGKGDAYPPGIVYRRCILIKAGLQIQLNLFILFHAAEELLGPFLPDFHTDPG